jgi:DNA invertase Pin-like site-specific DNA recombinase
VRRLYAFLLVFAEFERAIIRERLLVGIDRARDQGTQLGRRRLGDTDAKKVGASAATAIRHFSELLIAVRIALRLTPEIWAVSEQPAWRSLLVPGRPPWRWRERSATAQCGQLTR